ncbi:hypothetical protein [Gloeobacter kilaueensis]|uniref:Uncharacterized protein n=1 Tax=Gloeobacter kilaueensis (strain ATCC BAA-2537 / CCAP 1431/1 / ULC 316 / JS1) TaxID=1183438 RepID=U5QJN9_GLOK1|nr:hypothetical protein [Gloeobacter kilaueensis]AGY59212.1 hypothetical protein GKIL_2966 [Gloeobacter kilaueensis JS1]
MSNLPQFLFQTFAHPDQAAHGRQVHYTPARDIADWLLQARGEVRTAELVYSAHLEAYFYRCEHPADRAVQEEFGFILQPSTARY